MEGRSTLLTFGAYLTAALLLATVCSIAVLRYGLSRHMIPPELVTETADGDARPASKKLRAAAITLPSTAGTATADVDARQIQLLENLVEEKNATLRRMQEQLDSKTRALADLRAQYDEATAAAIDMLDQSPPSGDAVESAPTGPDHAPTNTPDPAQLETELAIAEAVQNKLVADMETLQGELDKAKEELSDMQMQMLTDAASNEAQANQLRTTFVTLFGSIGAPAVQPLTDLLNHANPEVRRWAAEALGQIGPDAGDAVAALTETLSDDNESVRKAARAALESIGR